MMVDILAARNRASGAGGDREEEDEFSGEIEGGNEDDDGDEVISISSGLEIIELDDSDDDVNFCIDLPPD